MKAKKIITLVIILLTITLSYPQQSRADDPPVLPSAHASNNDEEPGGGAPISGGIGFLVVMGVAYGTRKFFKQGKNEDKDL